MAGGTALLVIDMQREMARRVAAGRDCVNPDAGERVAALAAAFRRAGWPVVHVRQASDQPGAALHPEAPGYPPMPCAEAVAGEGAKFTVCLPQRQPAAAEAAVPTLLSP